jgi:glycine oxidase
VVADAGSAERAAEVAAGMIAPVSEARWGEDALVAAAIASAEIWPGFAAELEEASSLAVPYRRRGALHVALDRDEAGVLRRLHELHERLGLEASWLRASECRRLEPGVATDVTGGVEVPGEAEVDPRAVVPALRAALRAARGELREERAVEEIVIEGGRVGGARLADGATVAAPRVLLASGARWGSGVLPEEIAATLPQVRPVKGEVVRLRAGAGERPCERIVVTERVYVVPRDGEEVVLGATVEERGFDRRVTAGGVHELLREGYRVLPEIAELELVECTAGLRPATADNAPVVGASEVEGLLLAGGHHRNGILLAPITAEAIGALLAGEEPAGPAAALAPARLQGAAA